jgi:hypothetical protein
MFNSKKIARLTARIDKLEEAFALFMIADIKRKLGQKQVAEKKIRAKFGLKKDGSPKHKPGPKPKKTRKYISANPDYYSTPHKCDVCGKKLKGRVGLTTHTRFNH